MAIFNSTGSYMALPMNIKRGNPIPLDSTSIWTSMADMQEYASNGATAYVGQILSLISEADGSAVLYIIQDTEGTLVEVGKATVGDDKSITLNEETGELSITGFADATIGSQLVRTADGVAWVIPDTTTVEGLATALGTPSEEGKPATGLFARIEANEADIDAINTALENIYTKDEVNGLVAGAFHFKGNADSEEALDEIVDAKEGDVYQVGDKEYAFNGEDWIELGFTLDLTDYAKSADVTAEIGAAIEGVQGETTATIAGLEGRIDSLEELAGDTSVADQISTAINDLRGETSSTLKDVEDALETTTTALNDLKDKVGEIPAEKTVMDLVTEVTTTANTNKTDLADLTALVGTASEEGVDDQPAKPATGLIADIEANAKEIETINETISGIQESVGNVFTKEEIAEKLGELKNAEGTADVSVKTYVDTAIEDVKSEIGSTNDALADLVGVVGKATEGETPATGLFADVEANADAIAKLAEVARTGKAADVSIEDATNLYEASDVEAALAEVMTKANNAQADVDALESKVGTVTDGKTVVELIEEAKTAASEAGNDAAAAVQGETDKTVADLEAIIGKATEGETPATGLIADIEANAAGIKANKDAIEGLAGVANSGAAADVSIADEGDLIAADTVEGALQELAGALNTAKTEANVTITAAAGTEDTDYAKSYTIAQGGTTIGTIDIPKDMVVSSGSVVELADGDVDGKPADTYLKLVLANADSSEIYIPVGDLIEYVTSGSTAGDMVIVTVDEDHKVTATITDGTVTKAKLDSAVQASLDAADSAVQTITIAGVELSKESNSASAEDILTALGIDELSSTVITTISANGTALEVVDNAVDIPLAADKAGLVVSSDEDNKVAVAEDGTMEVNSLNVGKLYQDDEDTLILDGGSAAGITTA